MKPCNLASLQKRCRHFENISFELGVIGQISISKILSSVFFRAFSVFLQIHSSVLILSFKKPLPSELWITIYISTNTSDILKIVENSTKQPRLDCLSFFLDFVSATS
jgi:hypothetical protein